MSIRDQFDDEESTALGMTSVIVEAAQTLEMALIDAGFGYSEGDEESA